MFLAWSADAIPLKCSAPTILSFMNFGTQDRGVADITLWLTSDRRSEGSSMVQLKQLLLGCLVAAALSAPASAITLQLAGKFAFQTDVNLDKAFCARLTHATASRLALPPYPASNLATKKGPAPVSGSGPCVATSPTRPCVPIGTALLFRWSGVRAPDRICRMAGGG